MLNNIFTQFLHILTKLQLDWMVSLKHALHWCCPLRVFWKMFICHKIVICACIGNYVWYLGSLFKNCIWRESFWTFDILKYWNCYHHVILYLYYIFKNINSYFESLVLGEKWTNKIYTKYAFNKCFWVIFNASFIYQEISEIC